MSTDTLLRRYHETDDERYFAAGDGWPKLQGQLELMVKNLTGGDQDLAREVVQETAAKFLKKHREKSFTSTDRLGGLCYQTCCNLLRDHWRKQSRQKTEKTDPGILAGTISQSSRPALLPESAWEFLSPEALSSLPAEEQIYVELKQVTRSDKSKTPLSDHVIAQLMGTTRNRIQRIHKRAVDGLQRLLSESDEFDMDELKAWFLDSESPGVERA